MLLVEFPQLGDMYEAKRNCILEDKTTSVCIRIEEMNGVGCPSTSSNKSLTYGGMDQLKSRPNRRFVEKL